jgi:hypothetical protein
MQKCYNAIVDVVLRSNVLTLLEVSIENAPEKRNIPPPDQQFLFFSNSQQSYREKYRKEDNDWEVSVCFRRRATIVDRLIFRSIMQLKCIELSRVEPVGNWMRK